MNNFRGLWGCPELPGTCRWSDYSKRIVAWSVKPRKRSRLGEQGVHWLVFEKHARPWEGDSCLGRDRGDGGKAR